MDRVYSVDPSAGCMMFPGPLNYLETQSSVDNICGLNQIMIQIIPRSKR